MLEIASCIIHLMNQRLQKIYRVYLFVALDQQYYKLIQIEEFLLRLLKTDQFSDKSKDTL